MFVCLVLFAGCGGVYAQANVAPAPAPPVMRNPAADAMARAMAEMPKLMAGCPPGMSTIECGTVRNGLGPGLAIVYLSVNDGPPVIMNPNGGRLPLQRLLDGQWTNFVWPLCTRLNFRGECLYKFVGFAFPVIDMTGMFPEVRPGSDEYQLLTRANLNGQMYCFEEELAVTLSMKQNGFFVPSINPESVLTKCPFGMVPKGTTFAVVPK